MTGPMPTSNRDTAGCKKAGNVPAFMPNWQKHGLGAASPPIEPVTGLPVRRSGLIRRLGAGDHVDFCERGRDHGVHSDSSSLRSNVLFRLPLTESWTCVRQMIIRLLSIGFIRRMAKSVIMKV
jgi:hypothetical protein